VAPVGVLTRRADRRHRAGPGKVVAGSSDRGGLRCWPG